MAEPDHVLAASTTTQIQLTFQAARKIEQLSCKHQHQAALLRVYIEGGGCSGFQYGFELEDRVAEDDWVVSHEGVQLVIDPMSYQYLIGSKVDYKEDLQGSRFVIINPNATTTCGCGMSFSA